MAVKSNLIKQLKNHIQISYNKDLEKMVSLILSEIKNSLKRSERVELRGFGIFSSRIQKQSIRRNQKQLKN